MSLIVDTKFNQSCSAHSRNKLILCRHRFVNLQENAYVLFRGRQGCRVAATTKADALGKVCGLGDVVEIGPTPLGRGVVANKNIATQEELLSLPEPYTLIVVDKPAKALYHRENASWYSSYLERWQEAHVKLPEELLEFVKTTAPWDARLAAWLEWARKNGGSFWKHYTSILPVEQDMCSLSLFSEAERLYLQFEELRREAEATQKTHEHMHYTYLAIGNNVLRNLQVSEQLSDALRIVAWVRSRTFGLTINSVECLVMAPFIDMVNHSFSSNASVAWAQPGQITLKAKKQIPGCTEVLINYGEKSNVELMSAYGFTVPSNPHDSIEIALSESADKDVGVSAPSLLSVLGLEGDIEKGNVRVISNNGHARTWWDEERERNRLLSALRSIPKRAAIEADGFWPPRSWTSSGEPEMSRIVPAYEAPKEQAVVLKIQTAVQKTINHCQTSITADEDILQGEELHLNPRQRAAVSARIEYKKLLQIVMAVLSVYSEELSKLQRW